MYFVLYLLLLAGTVLLVLLVAANASRPRHLSEGACTRQRSWNHPHRTATQMGQTSQTSLTERATVEWTIASAGMQ